MSLLNGKIIKLFCNMPSLHVIARHIHFDAK